MDEEHKDPVVIDLAAPRLAWFKQKTWKKHQNIVYWVRSHLGSRAISCSHDKCWRWVRCASLSYVWSLNRCTVQRAPRYFVTTRAWIRRFWQPRQGPQWSRGYGHLQKCQCWTDRKCPHCQNGVVCSIGTERQHSYRKCQLSHCMSFAELKQMRRPPTRQDHGTYLDTATAPQTLGPLGPMAQVIWWQKYES